MNRFLSTLLIFIFINQPTLLLAAQNPPDLNIESLKSALTRQDNSLNRYLETIIVEINDLEKLKNLNRKNSMDGAVVQVLKLINARAFEELIVFSNSERLKIQFKKVKSYSIDNYDSRIILSFLIDVLGEIRTEYESQIVEQCVLSVNKTNTLSLEKKVNLCVLGVPSLAALLNGSISSTEIVVFGGIVFSLLAANKFLFQNLKELEKFKLKDLGEERTELAELYLKLFKPFYTLLKLEEKRPVGCFASLNQLQFNPELFD